MTVICPTVTANNTHEYREQIEKIAHFAERIHVDFMDGLFSRAKSPRIEQAWWPHSIPADLHLMYERPDLFVDDIIKLEPALVIIHAEAEGSFEPFAKKLHDAGIKVGVALLEDTQPELIESFLEHIDHVLIFSGSLGHFGGKADIKLLDKVKKLKHMKPELEIGWDGGINPNNAKQLMDGGVDVLNVGGYIQKALEPGVAYATLNGVVETGKHGTKTNN